MKLTLPKGKRLACVGRTGTGKSLLARELFIASAGRRRVVIDPNDDASTEGAYGDKTPEDERWPTTHATKLDWRQSATWRVVPPRDKGPRDQQWYSDLYEHLFDTRDVLVWIDEAARPTTSHQIPLGMDIVIGQGRKRNITHIACSPRPVDVHPSIWSQSEYFAIFKLPSKLDRKTIAGHAGIDLDRFEQMQRSLGPHGFIWWETPTETLRLITDGLDFEARNAELQIR